MQRIFKDERIRIPTRGEILGRYIVYAERELARGARLHHLARHILGLYHAEPGARSYRRVLGEQSARPGAGIDVLKDCLARLRDARMHTAPMAAE